VAGIDCDIPPRRIIEDVVAEVVSAYSRREQYPSVESFLEDDKKFSALFVELRGRLLQNPATMIQIEDEDLRRQAEDLVEEVWSASNNDEVWQEVFYEFHITDEITFEYGDRVKRLQPRFVEHGISNPEFQEYYSEAVRAWLLGLDKATVMLCCSVLEAALKIVLPRKSMEVALDLVGPNNVVDRDLSYLISSAKKEGVLTRDDAKSATTIRMMRNKCVHNLVPIPPEETYHVITETQKLVYRLLS